MNFNTETLLPNEPKLALDPSEPASVWIQSDDVRTAAEFLLELLRQGDGSIVRSTLHDDDYVEFLRDWFGCSEADTKCPAVTLPSLLVQVAMEQLKEQGFVRTVDLGTQQISGVPDYRIEVVEEIAFSGRTIDFDDVEL